MMNEIDYSEKVAIDNVYGGVEIALNNSDGETEILYQGDIRMTDKPGEKEGTVGVSLGITINLGNYESVKVTVWGSSPILKEESRDEVYQELLHWAENKIDTHRKNIKKALCGK